MSRIPPRRLVWRWRTADSEGLSAIGGVDDPALIERAGSGAAGKGTITSIYTVLADGDDPNDPVVDTARAILDGHILLSRQQAQMGIYPAIDVPLSVSRVMNEVADDKQIEAHRNSAALYHSILKIVI